MQVVLQANFADLTPFVNQIEKHTFGMLQCHPHPNNFSDKSRKFHCCYFMGLRRQQGVPVHEGEQFDIRSTVEEFKQSVNMYTLWKPGMEIQVSHMKRRNIPLFVFPGGIRPSRTSRAAASSADSHSISKAKANNMAQACKTSETNSGFNGDKVVCAADEAAAASSNGHFFEISERLVPTLDLLILMKDMRYYSSSEGSNCVRYNTQQPTRIYFLPFRFDN